MADLNSKTSTTVDQIKPTESSSKTTSIENGVDVDVQKGHIFTHDEYHLATLGYKQEFFRSLGFFESWAATFTSMNFVSGIPVLFRYVFSRSFPHILKTRTLMC